MNRVRSFAASSLLSAALLGGVVGAPLVLAPTAALAQAADNLITKDGIITGTMNIDFQTRTRLDTSGDLKPGSAALGVADKYTFTFRVADTTEFSGDITRQPNLYSKVIGSKKQSAFLGFNVNLAVFNPKDLKQKRNVGKWVGQVPVDATSGAFDLGAGDKEGERRLRIAIDTVGSAKGFVDEFQGRLVGKAEKKETLAAYTYKRVVGNKTTEIVVKKSDPLRFESLKLAKGPSEIYPATIVTGRLDYDYETGNWFTDGIRFRYQMDGKDVEDVITGSIKWVEDQNRATNGKGQYEFNLRFNEDKNKSAATESAAFDKMSNEDAFFAVDNSVPSLTGNVAYTDTMIGGKDVPASSKVEYSLNANKLTKQQVVNFFKLWMIAVGPTNDE